MRPTRLLLALVLPAFVGCLPVRASAQAMDFDLPAQPADQALLVFSKQANVEVLFSYDDLRQVWSASVSGRYEPAAALELLLRGTGFVARRNSRGKFVVARAPPPGPRPPAPQAQPATNDPIQLDPVYVEDEAERKQRSDRTRSLIGAQAAGGDLDLPRSEDDALPFTIYYRDQIARSGVVDLNQYLQRELLDSAATAPEPESNPSLTSFLFSGATNLNLRGYGNDETVILVNGRRLPDILIIGSNPSSNVAPDVSMIPLSLVERIEVLPVSASALYSGNPVGGVINIVLRSDLVPGVPAATEVTSTYTNALRGFNAPETSVSLLHSESLLAGALHLRLAANFTQAIPPTEAQLGYRQALTTESATLGSPVYGATPNVSTIASSPGAPLPPLFGPGTPSVTSVAPGADGTGGLAAFANRQGVLDQALFHLAGGGWSTSPDSLDYVFGLRQRRAAYYGSADYTVSPRLQVGFDGSYTRTVVNPGYDILTGNLTLAANSPFNPFGQDVAVSLDETAPQLGAGYDQAQVEFASAVLGLVVKLPAQWRLDVDGQYDHSLAQYRGLIGADPTRWQELVDASVYNPLRDTQLYAPPPQFYDEVLVYEGDRGHFATLGNYGTLNVAVRATNPSVPLPTGTATVNLGGDFEQDHFDNLTENPTYGDGSPDGDPVTWTGRTLKTYSFFGEMQAPLLPKTWLPSWLRQADAELALRYDADASSSESNLAPTFGLKLGLPGGVSLRGSATTSNRYPTPILSQQSSAVLQGGGLNTVQIFDPVRDQTYDVAETEILNPVLKEEGTVTETAGVIFERGQTQRLRVAVDFVDTRKNNEIVDLDPQTVLDLEPLLPGWVARAPLAPGDTHSAGYVTSVLTGAANLYLRHSQNWNASCDYSWVDFAGGTLDLYGRLVYFTLYNRQILSTSPMVDELRHPDGSAPDLLKYRVNFGASWSKQGDGFGLDGHYFGARVLPTDEWPSQGSDRIVSFWQFDAYLQRDLKRWLPWTSPRWGLRGQLRVNNLFDARYPAYANDPSGAGVQPYGDWRGPTYSLSLTVTF